MRAVVTCESCGLRQEVARAIPEPTSFHIVCHRCELSLLVTVTEADIVSAAASVAASTARR
jgi:transcription elongation factor Elf1